MVPVGNSVMLELVLAVHSYHVIAYPDTCCIPMTCQHCDACIFASDETEKKNRDYPSCKVKHILRTPFCKVRSSK